MMRIKRFEPGKPMVPQLSAAHLNSLIDMIESMQPLPGNGTKLRRYRKGFSYSSIPGAQTQKIKLGLTVKRATSSSVTVSPGIVSGCSVVAKMPTIEGEALNADPAPELGITPEAEQYIALKITVVPESTIGADGETYELRDGAGLVEGDIEVVAFGTTEEMDEASKRAEINPESGDVSENGVFIVPIGHISEDGEVTNAGYYFGPLGIKLCSSGILQVQGPIIAVATIE